MKTWWIGLLVLAIGCSKPTETPAPVESKPAPAAELPTVGTATISGKVTFRGQIPKPVLLKMGADPHCQSAHGGNVPSEEFLLSPDGTLRNVFVYIKQGLGDRTYPAPKTPVVLDQVGCLYRPHVQGIQVGQPLLVRNSDDTSHNVHGMAEINDAFNIGQAVRGMETKRVFTKIEVMLPFRCDVHSWMNAYLGVVNHPFHATTGDTGAFVLKGLPAGSYLVEAWHEKLGTRTQTVQLADDEAKTADFVFGD